MGVKKILNADVPQNVVKAVNVLEAKIWKEK